LYNIRSYVNQEIVFPESSTLLWGNIGSGKSTILLALDFALFGLQRSNLTGGALLRNGADTGFVELTFEIDDSEYIIMRALKRSRDKVVQDFGYVIKGGVKQEKTALEIKQDVLEILNYPKELLTKNKSLIFRYTVYTPQEEMKNILLGSKDERLDTLRKVFGVDKYKRIRDNAKVVATKIREIRRLYEGASADLSQKEFDKERLEKEVNNCSEALEEIKPKILLYKEQYEKKMHEIEVVEKKMEEIKEIKKEIELSQMDLKHQVINQNSNQEKIEILKKEIFELEREGLVIDEENSIKIQNLHSKVLEKERETRMVLNKIQELKTRKIHAHHIGDKVQKLNNCPTCFQEVSIEYKQKVVEKSMREVEMFEKEMKENEEKQKLLEEELKTDKVDLESLKKKEVELKLVQAKINQRDHKNKEVLELEIKLEESKKKIGEVNVKILELQEQIKSLKDIDDIYPGLKEARDKFQEKFRKTELENERLEASLRPIKSQLQYLSKEIERKKIMKERLEYMNKTLFWLSDYFIPLMEKMEKNILFKVHSEFSSYFEKWFEILVDNENLQMSLDTEYSPKILQNGYDIDYEFLSGGEKTAGALAYRLALNQVVNKLNTGIKTKDLLILDEPTDGFSQEQLERLKVLMEELDVPQVIMVSHEPRIESFVDNIIRLEKVSHETKIL